MRGTFNDLDPIEPFGTTSANVAKDHSPERKAVDLGQRFAIHGPSQHHFVLLDLAPLDTDNIVVHLTFLEVGVGAVQLQMDVLAVGLESATFLDDLF